MLADPSSKGYGPKEEKNRAAYLRSQSTTQTSQTTRVPLASNASQEGCLHLKPTISDSKTRALRYALAISNTCWRTNDSRNESPRDSILDLDAHVTALAERKLAETSNRNSVTFGFRCHLPERNLVHIHHPRVPILVTSYRSHTLRQGHGRFRVCAHLLSKHGGNPATLLRPRLLLPLCTIRWLSHG